MGRAPCCEKVGLKRGPWTPDEDEKLVSYINEHGHGSWRALPKKAGLLRCGKSCRLRWTNYLRPDIKRGEFTASEEQTIVQLHALLGNKWSAIASHLPKRTDNEIKNYWNTHMKKKLTKMGIDPTTHKPMADNTLVGNNMPVGNNKGSTGTKIHEDNTALRLRASNAINGSSTFSHMAQWESARLEAEARLAQESKLRAKGLWSMGATGKGANCLTPPTTPSFLTSLGLQPFSSIINNGALSLGAIKALSAVELMHALQNWEKSLQGQAGLLWPDSWRLSGTNLAMGEGQAESSSCSSHSTGAQTASSTVGAMPSSHNTDHRSPTSTLCSLDPQKAKQKVLDSSPLPAHTSKRLSWDDALLMQPNLEVPSMKSMNHPLKVEEKQQSFSSLMLDAMYGERAMTSPFLSSVEDGSEKNILPEQETCEKKDLRDKKAVGCMKDAGNAGLHEGEDVKVDVSDKEDVADEGLCLSEQMGSGHCNASFASTDADDRSDLQELRDPCSENDGEEEDGSMAIDTEMMNSEMFKDLPKLREGGSKASVSYTALLSEEISDCWSNLMLKEQVNSPTIHITF